MQKDLSEYYWQNYSQTYEKKNLSLRFVFKNKSFGGIISYQNLMELKL